MAMTALPTLDRTSATFKTDVDDFFATDLPLFVSEANALESNVVSKEASATSAASTATTKAAQAASSATIALTSANATTWVSGTTYALNDIVLSPIDNAPYIRIIAGAGTTDPSADTTNWKRFIQTGALGISPEYITANKTLIGVDSGYQIVDSSNTAGYTLTLPDATTLPEGIILYVIQNDSQYNLTLFDDGGSYVGTIRSNKTLAISLEDNSTANGVWVKNFESTSNGSTIIPYDPVVFQAASVQYTNVTMLSSTKAIVVYSSSNPGYACILDISGTTITPGTPAQFESSTINGNCRVVALSSTQAIVVYSISGAGKACILDISGSTVTPGTPVTFNSLGTTNTPSVASLTSTKVIVGYEDGASSDAYACILDISGSTITPATPQLVLTGTVTDTTIVALSSTKALFCYSTASLIAHVLDISGTTITVNAANTIRINDEGAYTEMVALSENKVVIAFKDTHTVMNTETLVLANISGSTVSLVDILMPYPIATSLSSICKLSDNKVLIYFSKSTGSEYGCLLGCVVDIFENSMQANEVVLLETNHGNTISIDALSSNTAIIIYRDNANSSYGTSKILQVGL